MYLVCFLLTLTGSCWSQMVPPPGQVPSAGMGAAGGMGGAGMGVAGTMGGAGRVGGVGGIPTHLLGEPGENPFALDGMCWNLERQVRASLPLNASPKEKMADKIQMAITSYLNGGGEIPSTGGGNIACVIRDAKKKAGKVKIMNADLATAVADKVADAGCRIPCFDPTTGTWAQPPPGMAPQSLTPALREPMTALPLDPMSASGAYPAMGAADPYVNNMAGPGPYDPVRSRGPYDPGMGGMGSMGGMGGMGPGPSGPIRGAGPYDPSMRTSGPYDPSMRTSGLYDPSMVASGPYDPSMGASGPYDPSMGASGPYDPSMGEPGPYHPGMRESGPYDPSLGASGPYDPSMGGPGPYDPSMTGAGPYDPSMAGAGPYDPSMGPYDQSVAGPGTFDQGLGGHGPSNSYPGQGGMGPDPYPADVGARSTSLQDRLQGRHLSHQMALHERRRMGPTRLRSQMGMGSGFQDHPLSRNNPTNPNTFTEHSVRQLNPSVTDTQPRGSFGQQTGFFNTDQSGGLSSRFTGSAQSAMDTGTNSLSQGTASFSPRNTALTDLVASPNRPTEGPAQSSQNLASGGTLKSSLVSSQALTGFGTGTNAIQALDGMAGPTGGVPGLMTQSKISSGMSHLHSGMSQDFANVRLQNARGGFRDQGMMSGRMSQTSRDASFLSDHPRSSMSQSSDMMPRPNWRMSARSNSHFNSHDMGREAALGGSSRILQSRDRHQQLRSGSSFGHNSRRMSWSSPGSSDRMSSVSHQSTSPSLTRSRMAQRSQFVTRRLGMQSPSSMNSQLNGQSRFLSSAVGGTSKTFSKRPTVNSVHETPGVAETGKNGDTFLMTSPDGLGGIVSSDTMLRKKETLSTLDAQNVSKFDTVGRNRLTQGTALTEKDIFLSKSDRHLNQDNIAGVHNPGIRESTQVANGVLSSPSIERGAQGLSSVSQQIPHDGSSVKDRLLGGSGSNNIQTVRKDTEMGLSNNGLLDSNTGTISGTDRLTNPVSNTNIQTDTFALKNTLHDVGQTDLNRKSEKGKLSLRNAVGSDPPATERSVVSDGMLTEQTSSHVVGDVNKGQGVEAGAGSTLSDGGKGGTTIVDGGKLSNAELASRFRPPVIIRKADINSPVRDPHIDKYGGRLRITQSLGTNEKVMEEGSVRGGNLRLEHGVPSSQPATSDIGVRKDVTNSRNVHGVDHAHDAMAHNVFSGSHLRSHRKSQDYLHNLQLAPDQRLGGASHLQSARLDRSFSGVVDTGLGQDATMIGSSLGASHPSGGHGSLVAGHRGTGTVDTLPIRHRTGLDAPTGHPMGARHAADMGFRNEEPFHGNGMGVAADVGFGNQGPDMGFGNAGPYSGSAMGVRNSMIAGSATELGFGHTDHIHGPDMGGMGGGPGMGGGHGMGMGLDSHHFTHTMGDSNGPDPFLLSLM